MLALANADNARDMGGYQAADGRTVKWGMLYRSDSIAHLDDRDLDLIHSLNLAVVTDFRSETERQAAPDRLPQQSPAIAYQTLAINNPAVDVEALREKVFAGSLSAQELQQLTDRRAYVNDPQLRAAWGQWLKSLSRPGALPQLFHCTAGKDRTGYAAALVLLTLGVSREQVLEDFMLSNTLLAPRIERTIAHIESSADQPVDRELMAHVIGVHRASLEDAFAEMESRFGSVDGYLTEGLGLDEKTRDQLRRALLQ